MKNRYEGLLVLNVKGNEESAKEIVERLSGDFKKEGAEIETVQQLGNRAFTYAAGKADNGYYVNFIFQGEPAVIQKLRSKFKLNADVYRQNFVKAPVSRKSIGRPVRIAKITPPPVSN
jgi:small subunit ribosomal protein S6